MNQYAFLENDSVNVVDLLGLVLVAVDGTDSYDWVFKGGAGSNILNFYRDWRGPGRKLYIDGPSTSGRGIDAAVEQGKQFICDALKDNPKDLVFLVGHSRGGLVISKIAEELASAGCSCKPNAHSVSVSFMGLYDAVNMSTNSNDPISSNVQNVAHGRRDPSVGSRTSWGNTATTGGKNYEEQFFKGTHSAMGGDPVHGDVKNRFGGEEAEVKASAAIDDLIRSNAIKSGAKLTKRKQ